MRSLLALLPCVFCLAGGCYGATNDSDDGSGSGSAGSTSGSKGGQSSGGQVGRGGASGGSEAGGSTSMGTAGSSGSTSAGTGAGGAPCLDCPPVVCEGEDSIFAGAIRSCTSVSDCTLVEHMTDCCGSILIMGINADSMAEFENAEKECTAGQPICDCIPLSSALDDGTAIAIGDTSYAVDCVVGSCQSYYDGNTFGCGDVHCTAQQYCTLITGGQPGSGTSASCSALGDCKSCDCLPAGAGCGCSQEPTGEITVSCAAP